MYLCKGSMVIQVYAHFDKLMELGKVIIGDFHHVFFRMDKSHEKKYEDVDKSIHF